MPSVSGTPSLIAGYAMVPPLPNSWADGLVAWGNKDAPGGPAFVARVQLLGAAIVKHGDSASFCLSGFRPELEPLFTFASEQICYL